MNVPVIVRRAGVVGRNKLFWRDLALHLGKNHAPLVRIVPDGVWPGMWRVLSPDGILSDMVNLSRAKDAAASLALRRLNHEGQETRRVGLRAATDFT
jgi:hypothetical protein